MKILHIWNIAGISSTLAKYQKQLQHHAIVIIREASNKMNFPHDINVRGSAKSFYFHAIKAAWRFDILHVHYCDKIVPILRRIYPRKKVVLTYHGTDIRNKWREREKYWKHAHLVTVSTPDLIPGFDGIQYTSIPIDREHYKRGQEFIPKSALFLWSAHSQLALDLVQSESKKLGLNLIIQDYPGTRFQYNVYPRFLELFEYYFDVKECFGKINPAMSKTGLEMLAMGSKVFYLGKILTEFPEQHDALKVTETWIKLYENL